MKSTKDLVEVLLEKGLPILLYQGMYDVKDGPSGTEDWMRSLNWSHIKAFWEYERSIWKHNGVLAGYIRSLSNLAHVVFVSAGHQVFCFDPSNCRFLNGNNYIFIKSWFFYERIF